MRCSFSYYTEAMERPGHSSEVRRASFPNAAIPSSSTAMPGRHETCEKFQHLVPLARPKVAKLMAERCDDIQIQSIDMHLPLPIHIFLYTIRILYV